MYKNKTIIFFGLGFLVWVFFAGILSDVIDVDAAQYAAISMEMVQSGSYLEVLERGTDYLDKPPFLFWISSLSYKVFNFTNFAYKFPTLFFSLFGLYYCYKLGELLYDKITGQVAAILLATSLGFFWMNNDVKTDGILMSAVVFSIYQLVRFVNSNKIKYLIFGSVGMAIGMLTKGPMGMVFPLAVLGFHLTIKKNLFKLIQINLLWSVLVMGVLLLPMSIGLYQQFDLHPDKIVNNKTGVSGLRFFYWEQSFGRITGENSWKNNTSFLYLFHTLLLLIFPYSFLVVIAYYRKLKSLFKKEYDGEYYTIGSLLILTVLSLSSYKIPHYVIVIFPLVAILVSSEFSCLVKNEIPNWLKFHNQMISGLVFLFIGMSFYLFDYHWFIFFVSVILLLILLFLIKKKQYLEILFISAISLGFIFNLHLVPNIQKYFVGRRFANLIMENNLEHDNIYFFNRDSRALEFYLERRLTKVTWNELIEKNNCNENAWFYMSFDGKEALLNNGLEIEKEFSLLQYDINRVDWKFLNPQTRSKSLEPRYLILFKTE